jgi:hypothetical protein
MVVADGAMSYQWQFNGTNLVDDARVTGSQSSLLSIENARMSDAGNYRIIITNFGGTNVSSTSLVVIAQPPTLQSAAANQASGTFIIDWKAPPGQLCQVQYQTNLSESAWINLGLEVNVTNGTVRATDSVASSQRFYRLVVLS